MIFAMRQPNSSFKQGKIPETKGGNKGDVTPLSSSARTVT